MRENGGSRGGRRGVRVELDYGESGGSKAVHRKSLQSSDEEHSRAQGEVNL